MIGVIRMISNPISGRRGKAGFVDELSEHLRAAGYEVDHRVTRGAGDATRLAADQHPAPLAVIVAGGDGTVREAVAGLIGSAAPLLVAPLGTENLVARHFGYRADPAQIVQTLRSWQSRSIDVARANGQPFLVVAGFGFDAEVVQRLAAARRGHISHWSYVSPIWRTFWSHRFPRLQVEADGQALFDDTGMVFVGNVPRYGLGLPLLRDALPDDGRLDLCIFRCRGRLRLLWHAWNVAWSRHIGRVDVIYRKVERITVRCPCTTPLELDGDDAGAWMAHPRVTPEDMAHVFSTHDAFRIDFTIESNALDMLMPAKVEGFQS